MIDGVMYIMIAIFVHACTYDAKNEGERGFCGGIVCTVFVIGIGHVIAGLFT